MKELRNKVAIVLLCLTLMVVPMAAAHEVDHSGPAADLRAALGQLLGEHALLAIFAMQKGYDGAADFEQAAGALDANTQAITAAIASIYGEEAGEAFEPIWNSHIGYFVDYVVATVGNDAAGREAALANLEEYRMEQAAFFNQANPDYFDAALIAEELKMHIDDLLGAFDSYVEGDYEAAYTYARTAYAHMFMTADALAGGIAAQFPAAFPLDPDAQQGADLRMALGQLLGEHALLAVFAMQKGIDGAADFDQAAGALLGNSDDVAAAIASIYGEAAGEAFLPIWNSHIGYFVDYVVATATNDAAGQEAALADLEQYRMEQAAFFNQANPEFFDQAAIAADLQMHIEELLAAFTAYTAENYEEAYAQTRGAYSHMFMTADALAGGIIAQFPELFHGPDGMTITEISLAIDSNIIQVDGQAVEIDVAPFVWEGTTFLSIRPLAETLGAGITWNREAQSVTVVNGNDTAVFWIGADYMELNGERRDIGTPVFVEQGRTQLPLRFIAELFGWEVSWNNADRTVQLTKLSYSGMDHSGMDHSGMDHSGMDHSTM